MDSKKNTIDGFDLIIDKLHVYLDYIVKNIGFTVIVSSVMGGLIQIIFLSLLSPSLTMFYSPKQGLVDGALFIMFLFFTTFFYAILLKVIINQVFIEKRKAFTFFLFLTLLTLFIITLIFRYEYISVILILPVIFPILAYYSKYQGPTEKKDQLINYKKNSFEESYEKIKLKKANLKFVMVYVLLIYSCFIFAVQRRYETIYSIENFHKSGEKIAFKMNASVTLIYLNSDYAIYKNMKNGSFVVLRVDDVLANY